LAFAVNDAKAMKMKLENKNILCEDIIIDEYTGRKFTFFEDPDGLPLEIYEE
jgi:glyoxylase I family protein